MNLTCSTDSLCYQLSESKFRLDCDPLRELRLFRKLSEANLAILRNQVEWVSYNRDQLICRQDELGESMYVVVSGRVKVTSGVGQEERILKFLDHDEHFGEMSVLTGGRRTANVIAVTETRLLRIDRETFDLLRDNEPNFSAMISETLANRLAFSVRGNEPHTVNRSVGVLYGSAVGKSMVDRLRDEIVALGVDVELFDSPQSDLRHLCERHDRVMVAETFAVAVENTKAISQCDRIFCFIDQSNSHHSLRAMEALLAAHPKLAPRVHFVWLFNEEQRFAPQEFRGLETTGRDFKVPLSDSGNHSKTDQGLRRIVRFLFNQRVGIALGGGGARGLAHLGVLRALEEEGIEIDLVSGTSMGALVGLGYAAGWNPREAETLFRQVLTPGWLFRMIPRGNSWYMIAKFRLNAWEKMLRGFFQHASFEQLQLPLCTVSADLLRGEQVIRESGDAVHAILESINLPYIARPILRDGRVLVDGGILNNVPVDLLRPRGANIVIGVDVCSQLPQTFGPNSMSDSGKPLRQPSILETVFRLNEIRRHRVCRSDMATGDHIIQVDTSSFEFQDFSQAHALADVGYEATQGSISQIRQLVNERMQLALKAGG